MSGDGQPRDRDGGRDADLRAELRRSGLTLEDGLSYGRRMGFIRYEGGDFLVSGTPYFWMIDFNESLSPERRRLLDGKGFVEQGNGLWMRSRAGMSSAEIEALARALDAKPGSGHGP
jgi:hypothetical protein